MSTEYTKNELEEYFTNKLTGTVTDTIEDSIKTELLAMAFEKAGDKVVQFTIVEMDKLAGLGNKKANDILKELAEKYEIGIEYDELASDCMDIAGTVTDIIDLGTNVKELIKNISDYFANGTKDVYVASECLQSVFDVMSSISGMAEGPLATIISEQLELGSFLLKKGTELAKEYNKRFDELEEVWEEIEKDEKQIDTDLQTKINDAITNSSKECKFYDTIKWYDAIMQEYGWIFSVIESEDSKELQEQYKEISTMLGKRENFMEHYQNVFKYANTQNYLGESNTNDYTTIKDEQKNDLGDAKNATPPADPIILDLNKDGTYSGSLEDGVHFDYDGDGFAEKTAWAAQGDGVLVRDINGNGIIDNGSELFGDKTMLSDGTTATGGLQALSDLDTNGDGILNSEDAAFGELKVWIDANRDGITQTEELHTLDELDITGILLNRIGGVTGENGNIISGYAEVQTGSGDSLYLAELNFQIDYSDTTYESEELSEEIKALPQLSGSGSVRSLRDVMADDTELTGLVTAFLQITDMAEGEALAEAILLKWTGCDNIEAGSRGENIDAAKLAVIEQMTGTGFVGVNGANPNANAAIILNQIYEDILQNAWSNLLAQTELKEYLSHTKVVTKLATGEQHLDYSEVINMFDAKMQESDTDAMRLFEAYVTFLQGNRYTSSIYQKAA